MKRFVSSFLALIMVFFCSVSLTSCSNEKASAVDKLVVYNWADYIYEYEVDFKEYYKSITGRDIEVTYVTFDTNETMITKITKGDSKIDVMCPSEYAIQKLMQMDSLVPMNYFSDNLDDYLKVDELANGEEYEHNKNIIEDEIVDKIRDGFSNLEITRKDGTKYNADMIDYMVPYMYGTLGILYNKKKFEELDIYDSEKLNKANWGILFNDSGERDENGNIIPLSDGLTGTILMKDSIRDTYAATLFYLVESGKLDGLTYKTAEGEIEYKDIPVNELINIVDDNIIKVCEETLIAQKDELFGYEIDFGKDDLLQGNAYVDLAWSGDALYAVEESWNEEYGDYELAYYVPHSTGNIWFDGWVIPKTYDPSHETAIKLFINFLNTPYSAVQNILEIGYTSSVKADAIKNDAEAMEILYEGYSVNPVHESDIEGNRDAIYEEYDYASIEEFENYFFNNLKTDDGENFEDFDEMGGANWRYPFKTNEKTEEDLGFKKREIDDLGMMRDFGDKNKDVIIMWNYVRSAGVSALPVFLIVMLSIAGVIGIVALCYYISFRKKLIVKVDSTSLKDLK